MNADDSRNAPDICKQAKNRQWNIYKLLPIDRVVRRIDSKAKLEKLLIKELSFFFNLEITVEKHNEAFWVKLWIEVNPQAKTVASRGNTTYLVHYPMTNFLGVTTLRVAFAEYILQSFLTVLHCSKAEKIPLKGRCIASLTQLAINRHSYGIISTFKPKISLPPPPLSVKGKRKREEPVIHDSRISCENNIEKKRKLDELDKGFGVEVQPTLEKIEYKLETKFKGSKFAPTMANRNKLFSCTIKFEGKSVITGMKNLGKAGLAEVPMKDHLVKLPSLGKSSFLLKQKELGDSHIKSPG